MSAAHEPNRPADLNRLLGEFGLDQDDWLDGLREARRSRTYERLGSYELLEEIGRGAQGVVYRAWQPGTQRYVALKHLVLGRLASEAMRGRFEREIQAAASLDHPHIVTIHGVERVDDRPFLLMEWIDGTPINRWVEKHRPDRDPRAIGPMVLAICEAVHHAHQRGVIHRDLKPSNILVDERGQPHLLDFGLAKHIDDPNDETLSGEFVGTPAYAAPEQFSSARTADVRFDVYSIGVVLFELLTGALPYDAEPGPLSWLRAIERDEPRAPSALRPGLPRDLDLIVLQALAKDPARRYPSADALREDLQRFLDGRPVLAHPPSSLYLMSKLVRRHAWPFAMAISIVVSLIVFTIVTGIQNEELRGQIRRAQRAEKLAGERLEQVERARGDAVSAGEQARDAAERAESVLGFFLDDVLGRANPFDEGWSPTLLQAVEQAERRLEGSQLDGETLSTIHQALGSIYRGLGRYEAAERHLEEALDLRQQLDSTAPQTLTLRTLLALARLGLGQFDTVVAELESLLAEAESRPDVSLEDRLLIRQSLGEAKFQQGHIIEAEAQFEHAIEQADAPGSDVSERRRQMLGTDYALVLRERGRRKEAIEWLEKTIAVAKARGAQRSQSFTQLLFNLGQLRIDERQLEGAIDAFREALALLTELLGDEHPATGYCRAWLAKALYTANQPEALAEAAVALAVLEKTLENDVRLAEAYWIHAEALQGLARGAEAEADYQKGLAIQRALHGESSLFVATAHTSLGNLYLEMGRIDEALASHEKALAVYAQNPGSDLRAASSHFMIGRIHSMRQAYAAAKEPLERARQIYLQHEGADETLLGFVLADLAWVTWQLADPGAALEHARASVEIEERRGDFPPSVLAVRRATLARILFETGAMDEALKVAQQAFETLQTASPMSSDRVACEILIAQALTRLERFEEAEKQLQALHARLEKTLGARHEMTRATAAHLAALYEAWQKPEEARRWKGLR